MNWQEFNHLGISQNGFKNGLKQDPQNTIVSNVTSFTAKNIENNSETKNRNFLNNDIKNTNDVSNARNGQNANGISNKGDFLNTDHIPNTEILDQDSINISEHTQDKYIEYPQRYEDDETNNEYPNTRFAYLGGPRDFLSKEVIGNIRGSTVSENAFIQAIHDRKKMKPYYFFSKFKLLNRSVLASSISSYVVSTILLIVIIVSVMASVTQGLFLIKDKLFPDNIATSGLSNQKSEIGQTNQSQKPKSSKNSIISNIENMNGESIELGSDDGKLSTVDSLNIVPLYKVANADLISGIGISAKGYYVADIQSGERIMSKNSTDVFPIASVSKLMTAVVARERIDLQKVVIVSRDSYNAYGTQGELLPGEKIKIGDLMFPLLMESSNDGAEVIAESFGRVEFIAEMNKKAVSLGMNDTYFEDPSGLNPKNVSNSEDLFKLLKYAKEKFPDIYDMTRVREFAILKHKWFNKNRFLNTEIFLGGKNGYIEESRWTTASLFDITLAKGGKRQIAIVLLKSENREGDATKIINFLQKNVFYTETGIF